VNSTALKKPVFFVSRFSPPSFMFFSHKLVGKPGFGADGFPTVPRNQRKALQPIAMAAIDAIGGIFGISL